MLCYRTAAATEVAPSLDIDLTLIDNEDEIIARDALSTPRKYAFALSGKRINIVLATTTEGGRIRWMRTLKEMVREILVNRKDVDQPMANDEDETVDSVVQLTIENRLDELDLSELNLTSWPELADGGHVYDVLPRILILDLSCNPLATVPTQVEQWTHLEEFSAQSCLFQNFPSVLFSFEQLISLTLTDNRIEAVPNEIGLLVNLERLRLQNNRLKELPVTIGCLRKLEELNVSGNKFIRLPSSIGELRWLLTFEANSCSLDALPAEICHLERLLTLDLGNNRLCLLPRNVGALTRLVCGFPRSLLFTNVRRPHFCCPTMSWRCYPRPWGAFQA